MRYRHEIYYNLHKHCLSVRALQGVPAHRHVFHADAAVLNEVTFAVQQMGRYRVITQQRKNVHAFVRGELLWVDYHDEGKPVTWEWRDAINGVMTDPHMIEVTYNPYKFDSFVNKTTLTPVKTADIVYVVGKSIYALGAK